MFVKETLLQLKSHIDPHPHTAIVGEFNTPLSPMDRPSRQKLNKRNARDVINQMNLTDIYRIFHSQTKEYTFFSALHGTFSKTAYKFGTQSKSQEN